MGRVVFAIDIPEAIAPAIRASEAAQATAAEAQQTADEAKSIAEQAGTAAASVNGYMDALLGLGATDETEATDAE